MNSKLIAIILFLFIATATFAQFGKNFSEKAEDTEYKKKFFTGGGIGFWMWQYEGYVYVSPMLGYHLSPSFDIGTRYIYSYYWYNDDFGLKFDEHDFGAGVFGRYYMFFYSNLFAHAEYEFLSHQKPVINPYDRTLIRMERVPINNFYIGGGLRQWMSQNAYVSLLLLFNLNETEYSPDNPIIRIGFGVGL